MPLILALTGIGETCGSVSSEMIVGRRFGGEVTEMDVRYLMLARHAELAPDGSAHMMGAGAFLRYGLATPTVLPILYLVSQLTMSVEEAARPHTAEFRILDPQGDQIAESGALSLAPQKPDSEDAENMAAVFFFGVQNLPLSSPGRYRFWLHLDGAPIREALLKVVNPSATTPPQDTTVGDVEK